MGYIWGQVALPDQQEFIKSVLMENLESNPPSRVIPYQINARGHNQIAAGFVFIDGRELLPKVYVEDKDQGWLH